MRYQGRGHPLTAAGLEAACATLSVTPAHIWTIVTVETAGFGFLADRRPQLLFERHVFRRITKGRFDAVQPDLSNRNPGGYLGRAAEYERLARASALNRTAALQSASWGIGQVMGFNFSIAGFVKIDAMVSAMIGDEDAQLMAMARFLEAKGLAAALRGGKWATFARGYNGAAYRENRYDERLAAAFAKQQSQPVSLGDRAAQAALLYLGFNPGPIDGVCGPKTRAALSAFQRARGLKPSGELDQATWRSLSSG